MVPSPLLNCRGEEGRQDIPAGTVRVGVLLRDSLIFQEERSRHQGASLAWVAAKAQMGHRGLVGIEFPSRKYSDLQGPSLVEGLEANSVPENNLYKPSAGLKTKCKEERSPKEQRLQEHEVLWVA